MYNYIFIIFRFVSYILSLVYKIKNKSRRPAIKAFVISVYTMNLCLLRPFLPFLQQNRHRSSVKLPRLRCQVAVELPRNHNGFFIDQLRRPSHTRVHYESFVRLGTILNCHSAARDSLWVPFGTITKQWQFIKNQVANRRAPSQGTNQEVKSRHA